METQKVNLLAIYKYFLKAFWMEAKKTKVYLSTVDKFNGKSDAGWILDTI